MTISDEGYAVSWNLGPQAARGDVVRLNTTHRAHLGGQESAAGKRVSDDQFVTEFRDALRDAFYRVNSLQKNSEQLTRQLAVQPDSVDIHDVTIAAEKARLSLMLTKSIVDRITQAYRELINMR